MMMNLLKKTTITALLLFFMTSAFANIKKVEFTPPMSEEVLHWKIVTKDDGQVFLLLPEDQHCLVITVDKRVRKNNGAVGTEQWGPKADTVTLRQCSDRPGEPEAPRYVAAGKSHTCFEHMANTVWLLIDVFKRGEAGYPGNFFNGASGTYQYVPLKKCPKR
jgi:hypothetical protein